MDYERLQRSGRERYLDRAVLAGRGYIRHGLLGQGTFSDVYCIEDAADGRRYACKVSWRAEMLEREARVLEEVRHPLYPEFAGFWRADGLGILLREYVPGRSLEELLGRRRAEADRPGVRMPLRNGGGLPGRFPGLRRPGAATGRGRSVRILRCVRAGEDNGGHAGGGPGQERHTSAGQPGAEVRHASGQKALGGKCGTGARRPGPGPGKAREQWPDRALRIIAEKNRDRGLRRILAACTEEAPEKRIADMGKLMEALARVDKTVPYS